MVAGIPKGELSVSALDILLGKYRIAGRSSGIPQRMPEAIQFSHDHGVSSHVSVFNDINDINKMIDMMEAGQTAGRLGIVFE